MSFQELFSPEVNLLDERTDFKQSKSENHILFPDILILNLQLSKLHQ